MPFWIQGWIEVATLPDVRDEHVWSGVVNLDAIMLAGDEISERLFGLSKAYVRGERKLPAYAADRGVPANPSDALRRALDEIAEFEAKHGAGEIGGYTYATWEEVKSLALDDTAVDKSGWKTVFAMARALEQRFEAKRIRFVVWFNW